MHTPGCSFKKSKFLIFLIYTECSPLVRLSIDNSEGSVTARAAGPRRHSGHAASECTSIYRRRLFPQGWQRLPVRRPRLLLLPESVRKGGGPPCCGPGGKTGHSVARAAPNFPAQPGETGLLEERKWLWMAASSWIRINPSGFYPVSRVRPLFIGPGQLADRPYLRGWSSSRVGDPYLDTPRCAGVLCVALIHPLRPAVPAGF